MNYFTNDTRRKVFISYHHANDEFYKKEFERLFGHIFINKSVRDGDIDSDNSDVYIKRLIQSTDYLAGASVCVVLIGTETYKRKHVDWETYGALDKRLSNYSGLLGILLPTFPLTGNGQYYNDEIIPPRLNDNIKSGYSNIYTWTNACNSENRIKEIIETAFNNKLNKSYLIDNSRLQFVYNKF